MRVLIFFSILLGWMGSFCSLSEEEKEKVFYIPSPWQGHQAGNVQGNPLIQQDTKWSLYQIWPDDPFNSDSYRLLVWDGKENWIAQTNGFGGQPSARVDQDQLILAGRGGWSGANAQRLAALGFSIPYSGVYAIRGEIQMKFWHSRSSWIFYIAKRNPKEVIILKRYELKGDQIASPFSLQIDNLFCDQGEELLFFPRYPQMHTAGNVILKGLSIKFLGKNIPKNVDELPSFSSPRGQQIPPLTYTPDDQFPGLPHDALVSGRCINVKTLGAKGDGIHDDTFALQQAFCEVQDGIIYLPAGIYLVSDTIAWTRRDGKERWPYRTLHGAGKDQTIIRLKAHAPGFNRPEHPKPILETGGQGIGGQSKGSQAFHNSLYHLTIDIEEGNPGAVGIYWWVSNEGVIRHVNFRSHPSSGKAAILYNGESCGLVCDVTIDGFDYAIQGTHAYQNLVGEHVTIKNQKVAGIWLGHGVFDFHHLISENRVPVVIGDHWLSRLTVQNGQWENPSVPLPNRAAIELKHSGTNGIIYLRDIQIKNYEFVITSQATPEKSVKITQKAYYLKEWSSHPFQGDYRPENSFTLLPAQRAVPPWPHPETWISGKKWIDPQDLAPDFADSIQRAIDSGAEVVYLPTDTYTVIRPIILRGKVRRLVGLRSRLYKDGSKHEPTLIIRDNEAPEITVEMFNDSPEWIRIDTERPVIIRDCVANIDHTPRAKLIFLEGVCGNLALQNVEAWIRQLNPEGKIPGGERLLIDGGKAWILGCKTEGIHPQAIIRNGAKAEIVSLIHWHMGNPTDQIGLLIDDSWLRIVRTTRPDLKFHYHVWAQWKRAGVTFTLLDRDAGPMQLFTP